MDNKDCAVVKLSICFFCGKEKNELLLATRQTEEWCNNKSRGVVANYEPCDKCAEGHKLGVWLIEASGTPIDKGQPEMQEGVYPTGNSWVVKKEVLNIDSPVAFVTEELAKEMGLYGVPDTNTEDKPE